MEEKKELTPIEEQALDQVTGGYISPMDHNRRCDDMPLL